jgi:hypothetical protein
LVRWSMCDDLSHAVDEVARLAAEFQASAHIVD